MADLRRNLITQKLTWRGERWSSGLQEILRDKDIAAQVVGFGGTFSTYFLDGEVSGYRQLLENNTMASVQFHRRMIDRGFLMIPHALKRNHISGSHTVQDIDRTLAAAADSLQDMLEEGYSPGAADPAQIGRPPGTISRRGRRSRRSPPARPGGRRRPRRWSGPAVQPRTAAGTGR